MNDDQGISARRPGRAAMVRALAAKLRLPTHRRAAWIVAAGLVVVATICLIAVLGRSTGHRAALPPTPPRPAAALTVADGGPGVATAPKTRAAAAKPFHCSVATQQGGSAAPVRICIPRIQVDASVLQLGLNPDHTVEVPTLSQVADAGWYKYSAVPGAVGPTVILGHIDSAQYGQGVFFKLGTLQDGDNIIVARQDGMTATFRVNTVSEVAKTHFPVDDVYGATSGPAIRLLTCGGQFDSATGNYVDNIIVYGTLLSLDRR